MSALKLAFAFGGADLAAPSNALTEQIWTGGLMRAGADAKVEGAEQRLLLCDLPADAPSGFDASGDVWTWFGVQILGGDTTSPADAGGLLINIMSVGAAHEEEFNEWYDAEHMPRLSAVDGALSCRRFKAIDGDPTYAAIYHLRDRSVCQSAAWFEAASTPWGARMRRLTHGNRRMTFQRGA
jgi:hypothetical protein